jgi:hypothetical protein
LARDAKDDKGLHLIVPGFVAQDLVVGRHIINGELGTLQVTTYMCMVPDMKNELHASAFVYNIAKEQIKMAALQGRIRRQVPIPRLSIPNDESHVAKKQLLGMAYGMV